MAPLALLLEVADSGSLTADLPEKVVAEMRLCLRWCAGLN